MIPPAATNLQVARRAPFPGEAAPLDQGYGSDIHGLDVCLKTMQAQTTEGMAYDKFQALCHETLSLLAQERIVAETCALE
jgi:hypothetical protein